MTKSKFSTKYLVEMALLVAIILLMAFTPIAVSYTHLTLPTTLSV